MDLIFLILSTSVFMSLIILLTMGLFKLMPDKISGKTRYLIWILILISLIIPFRPLLGDGFLKIDISNENSQDEDTLFKPDTENIEVQNYNTATDNSLNVVESKSSFEQKNNYGLSFSISDIVLLLWSMGAIISFSRYLYNYYKFKKMLKRWGKEITKLSTLELFDIVKEKMGLQHKKISLMKTPSISTPMLTGFFKPIVLLPDKAIEDDELELIFEHELTHYKHKDLYINLLGALAVSIHWFNPVIYFSFPAIQSDSEECCDEAVLSGRDQDYRRFYGEVIIGMIEKNKQKNVAFSTCFYAKKTNIKRRLFAIMKNNNKKRGMSLTAITLVLTLIILSGSIIVFGEQGFNSKISDNKAKEIALKDAGFNENQVTFVKVKEDIEDNVPVYEIEFYNAQTEYDYEIDARNGKILSKDLDIEDFSIPQKNKENKPELITAAKAKEIALKDAGFNENQVTFVKVKEDIEDNVPVYEIEFYNAQTEYDYEIDARNGKILSKDLDIENFSIPQKNDKKSNNQTISLDKAKSIALAHAGLQANQVKFTKTERDTEDGIDVYEIEFKTENVEYEYEINAVSGNIIDFNKEIDD